MTTNEPREISRLIRASADDLKTSLRFCDVGQLDTLREALRIVEFERQKTKAMHLRRRIKQLEKAG